MTPGARIAAAIAALEEVFADGAPADRTLTRFLRRRRYMGAKDRRFISDLVFTALRHRARLMWWLRRAAAGRDECGEEPGARALVLACLVLVEKRAPETLSGIFSGSGYAPAPLTPAERRLVAYLAGHALDHPQQPPAVRGEVPDWLLPEFRAAFGAEASVLLDALKEPAPLDLRINTLKVPTRAAARAALAADGIAAAETPWSPLGLRVEGRPALGRARAFRDGLVEVQDEGAQVAALLVGARPGMAVADLCAGAGGKTLALAATMDNNGWLVALDIAPRRLVRATARLRRAGVEIADFQCLKDDGPDSWLRAHAGRFDRVLVDVPCSGTGTWRRNPDARWRLSPAALTAYHAAQTRVLDTAADLVRPGGRIVYVTCSLLPSENAAPIEALLHRRGGLHLVPAAQAWDEALGTPLPHPSALAGPYLQLRPDRHGCDGFFAAVVARTQA
ncbi:MAG: RsmB/NOP family class I SAM-dependent RNA methyltransferase [Alphaproteobacteria bacterium]|nr:MAG: RsmB/NOP family class I SAM-dependent RNA methyltransferase [Alphaproteobacteria bacterium]